jgi:hypothetical protein
MRVFTGWNNPFGGSGYEVLRKILVSGILEANWEYSRWIRESNIGVMVSRSGADN